MRRSGAVFLLLVVIILSAAYLFVAYRSGAGRAVAPLDDAYITFQYARQAARGQPFRYNDGETPTTGLTSFFYTVLLSGVAWLGASGERLVAVALGLGVVWLGASAWLVWRIASHLFRDDPHRERWAALAALIVLLTGPLQWGCFNGMETGLFLVLILTALDALVRGRDGLAALWLGLSGLTRPDGLVLTLLTVGVVLVHDLWTERRIPYRRLTWLAAAAAIGLVPSLVNVLAAGAGSASGLQAKSWLLNVPFGAREITRSILLMYREILVEQFTLGWAGETAWAGAPGLLVAAVWGWWSLTRSRSAAEAAPPVASRRLVLLLTPAWFFVGNLATATLITATWHVGRYQVPLIPVVVLVAVVGLQYLAGRGARRWPVWLATAGAAFLVGAALYGTMLSIDLYRRAMHTVRFQQVALADWVRENLPEDVCVGVHDAGALRYVGERPIYDMIGLTTAGAPAPWRHGAGGVLEQMERAPCRPTHFATYPDAFSLPYLAATDLFAEELFRASVPGYVVASAGPDQAVWRADWTAAEGSDRVRQPDVVERVRGMVLVDAIDVAYLLDEAAHGLEWWHDAPCPGFPTDAWQLPYAVPGVLEVLDGGRLLHGGMTFVATAEPGVPLWLVGRFHPQYAGRLVVEVDGEVVGEWAYPALPGRWLESAFLVPGARITRAETRVTLRVVDPAACRPPMVYHLWVYQGDGTLPVPAIERPFRADLGELALLGFDLARARLSVGETLVLTLYWQTDVATESDARVFVHLYDAQGKLGPQSDGWAYYDTRPPFTWRAGEPVIDPRAICIPPDLAPGIYTLEVGLYVPDSGRLPAFVDGVRQFEERVVLATIEIEG